jgi:hypothetical protein
MSAIVQLSNVEMVKNLRYFMGLFLGDIRTG